jgi:hypothetical protein
MNALGSIRRILMDRRMVICMATGFASGLPLYIIMQLIPAWLRLEGVSLTADRFFYRGAVPLCAQVPVGTLG